jgi:arsenate reductase
MPRPKRTILFICQSNSSRSQMAEAFVNNQLKDRYEAFSAGTQPTKLDPLAVKAMKEVQIDISKQKAKGVETYYGKEFDYVVTLCDEAEEECSFFIKGRDYVHKSFAEPSQAKVPDDKLFAEYRRSRDDIRAWMNKTFGGG